jgi:peptide/nickel transport system substrate-binding protein
MDRPLTDYEYHLLEEGRAGRMTRRELIRRASVAGISLPVLGAILAACGGGSSSSSSTTTAAAGTPKRGGTIRFGCSLPTAEVDPVTMFDQGAIFTVQLASDYLAVARPDYSLVPSIATGWQQGSTPQEWTFRLRPGVLWQDGTPLTADDVVATMDRLTNPKVNSAALSAFAGVLSYQHTEKVDDHTIRFHLDRPFVDFPYQVSSFNYNAAILPKNYAIGDFIKGGIGCGPFKLTDYKFKESATFVRNPHYWQKGKPYLDGAQMKYYSDTQSTVLALEAGAIDVFPQTPYAGSQPLFSNSQIQVLQAPSSEYRSVDMRVDRQPFTDKRVRQAIAYSLDRPGIVQALFAGRAQIGDDEPWAPVYPTAPSPSELPQRHQDYAKAKQLLAAAGHTNGVKANMIVEQFLEVPQYAQLIQQQCKPAGIDITLTNEDQSTFYGSGKNQPWLVVPFCIVDWGGRGSVSQLILPAYTSKGIWNSAHWHDPQFDKLMNEFDGESDEAKRKALALQAAKIQQDATPALIAYWIKGQRTARKNVMNLPAGPVDRIDATNIWLA